MDEPTETQAMIQDLIDISDERDEWRARAETAEAEVARLRAQLADSIRGNAMTAADLGAEQREVARLREALAEAQEEVEHWRVNCETLLAMKATLEATP